MWNKPKLSKDTDQGKFVLLNIIKRTISRSIRDPTSVHGNLEEALFTSECNETSLAVETDMQIFTRSVGRSVGQ